MTPNADCPTLTAPDASANDALLRDAGALQDRLTSLRRAIHAEPELGLHTPKTIAKVRAALAHLPLEWRTGPSTTGAVALLRGGAGPQANRPVGCCAAIWTRCRWGRNRPALCLASGGLHACLRP